MTAAEKDMGASLAGPDLSGEEPVPISSSARDAPAAYSPSIWRRIRRDLVLLGAGNVGIVTAQLAFRGILVAVLVPAGYGRLSLILSIYNTAWIIAAGGMPNSVARYISAIAPADDSAIVRSAVRAGIAPTAVAAAFVAAAAGVILNSSIAFLFGAIGLSSLAYSLLTMGILRGRGRIGSAASVMPICGASEVALLAILLLPGLGVTPLSAFGAFCLGNVVGLIAGIFFTRRTAPHPISAARHHAGTSLGTVPSSRQLLGFSMWLTAATVGVAALPLVLRFAAAFDSYTVVAIIDVALVLLTIPSRIGALIVAAVVPHATQALTKGNLNMALSRREHFMVIAPFVLAAIIVAFTPIVGWLFDSLGRPEYAKSADYLALALLAGPARVLYGVVEGMLVAHSEGRFMAINSLSVTVVASGAILVATALGSMMAAFVVFVIACWAVYVCGLQRIRRFSSIRDPLSLQA